MTVAVHPPRSGVAADRPAARILAAGFLVGVMGVALANARSIQGIEAASARPFLAVLLGRAVHLPGSNLVFYPNYTGDGFRSLQVTSLCSVTPLVLPILTLGALAALQRRFSPLRVCLVTLLLVGSMFVVNVGRICMICIATRHWGPGGFELTHRVVGSALIMASMAVSLVVGARLLSPSSGGRIRSSSEAGS